MLAKSHITIGMAAAFTIMKPESVQETLPVITGAALGCLICDIDCENKSEKIEASRWGLIMGAAAAAALILDHFLDAGMWGSLAANGPYQWFIGVAGFVLTCTFASASSHRGFSHSILALILETVSLWLVFPKAAAPFAIAFVSHQILDLMNKKPIRLFYPAGKGFCLGWFYADRLANRVFNAAGAIWLAAAVIICCRSWQ